MDIQDEQDYFILYIHVIHLMALCRERFAFLFDLSANERPFLDDVLDRGEINADLLDVGPETQTRIDAMPMLAWKTVLEDTPKLTSTKKINSLT